MVPPVMLTTVVVFAMLLRFYLSSHSRDVQDSSVFVFRTGLRR